MSWVPGAFPLKTPNKCAYCTTHTCVYHITQWSSCLDWSKFSYVMSWVPGAFPLKMPNKCAYCTTHTCVYHITQWSSRLDWSKFSHTPGGQWVKNMFNKIFLHKITPFNALKMSKERLFFGIFGPKQSPLNSHNDLKKDGAQLLLSK